MNPAMLPRSWLAAYRGSESATGAAQENRAAPSPLRAFANEVVELSLLVTVEEAAALECSADLQGLTVAQLLRGLVRESLAHQAMRIAGRHSSRGGEA